MAGLAVSACAPNSDDTVLVLAAASLVDAFADIEAAFEAEHPEFDVQFSIAGSSALREQVAQGVPADVFASANDSIMAQVVASGATAGEPAVFALNELAIAVPRGNPGEVTGLADLANPDLLVGLCARGVPCGDFARQVLAAAGVTASVDTEESDARALLTRLAEDELDVGVVYATDVAASPAVSGLAIDATHRVDIRYPLAVLKDAPNPAGGRTFVDFVLSQAGQEILQSHGFATP